LCRSGAAFRTRFDLAIGSDLEIRIPLQGYPSRRWKMTSKRRDALCMWSESLSDGEKVVGVQFVGRRFQRVFRSESAA